MKNRVGPRPAVVVLIVGSLFPACGASVNGEVPAAPVALSNEKAVRLPKRAAAFAASATAGSPAYKIGPQDVLDVSVFKAPELTRSVQVADTGTINLPLVGEVQAGGRTAQEIERDLAKRLGVKYMQAPQVTVYVKEYNSQRVTVEGAVKKPGVYPLRGKTTLMQSLAVAGGLDETSDSNVIDTPTGARDRVVLTLGFAGALRPSEVVGLNVGRPDSRSLGLVEISQSGLRLTVQRTVGSDVPIVKAIPRGGNPCPVEALERWLALAQINHGPIVRKLKRSGALGPRMHFSVVGRIIRRAAHAEALGSGLDPEAARERANRFGGFSLRIGFVTSAVRSGASSESIARHVGWKSVNMVSEYRRRGGVFHKHPVQRVLAS
jgi:polysaccharide export outer membrane protein